MVYGKDNRSFSGVGGEWGRMGQGRPIWGTIRAAGHNLMRKTRKSLGGGFRGVKRVSEKAGIDGKTHRTIDYKTFRMIFDFV